MRTKPKTSTTAVQLGLLIAFFVLGSCADGERARTLKLAHGLDQNHSVHKAMVFMAQRVEEKSGGRLLMDVYAGGQLGTERENVEMLQIGSLAITKVSAAILEGFAPSYAIFGLPFLFQDKPHLHRVLDSEIGRELLLDTERYWLRGLTFYDAGSRSFYTSKRPILHPDDLRGLKIRVMQSPSAIAMIRAFGGSPTPLSWGELYTALQAGVVDGAENNPPSFVLSHHYEISRYYSLTEHTTIPDVLAISTKVWNTLSAQEQQWVQEAADESAQYQRILWEASERETLERARQAGVQILIPDKAPFIERVQGIHAEMKRDPRFEDLINRIHAKRDTTLAQ